MRESVAFGNDISRIVRGVAIILMVAGHSMPGHVVAFAVPLFSFLVGYGYNFARERNLRHAAVRSWHMLGRFWFILFLVCIPAALITVDKPLDWRAIGLNLFGLNAKYNFFCWYIWFYIIAISLMPVISRAIDRWGWKALLVMGGGCAAVFFLLDPVLSAMTRKALRSWTGIGLNVVCRTVRYLPVVMAGYWVASKDLYSKIKVGRSVWIALAATAGLVVLYFLRGIPGAKVLDFACAPAAGWLMAVPFGFYRLGWIRKALTALGVHSMGIWFLHAVFFTHTTRKLFIPLIDWIPAGWLRVLPILLLSLAMAAVVEKAYKFVALLLKSLTSRIPAVARF